MIFFQGYMLFALTTSIVFIYEIVHPVMLKQFSEVGSIENKKLLYTTMFIMGIITAPLVFFSCLVPSWGIVFRESLQKALFQQE